MTPDQIVAIATAALPVELMQFTLIYDGDLPAGGDKRVLYASKVRNQLHGQLADLWESHVIMRQLAREARISEDNVFDLALERKGPLPDYRDAIPAVEPGTIDLCAPKMIDGIGAFRPLVMSSLHLACSIDILFLRHEEPMHLFVQGGDLDNRIKCFFDGLKMPEAPKKGEIYQGEALTDEPLCCLLEDDKWISDFSVRTGRLLGHGAKMRHAVRITADVTVKVLRVMNQNLPLVGG